MGVQLRSSSRATVASAFLLVALGAIPVASAAPKRLPDLAVSSAKAGGGTLTVRLRNTGKATAKPSTMTVLLSADASPSADDAVLAAAKAKSLRRKASATLRVGLKVPAASTLPAGTWRVLACADGRRKVKELKEADNCRTVLTLQGTKAAAPASPGPAPAAPAPPAPPAPALPPVPPADATAPDTTITSGPAGTVTGDDATFAFSSSEAGSRFECRLDLNGWSACTSPHVLTDLPGGERRFEVRAVDGAGNADATPATRVWTLVRPAPAPGPADPPAPDPVEVAPPVDETAPTSVGDATAFLYKGADPIQDGVRDGAIKERRAAVMRGCVRSRMGSPLDGVRVSVVDHPELGHTATRVDGCFDLALNGGGAVTLAFERRGYLPLQRTAEPGWETYDEVADVVLVPYDPQATEVDLDDPAAPALQVARGSEIADPDGERQATLLFEKGTDAVMELPDGSTKELTDLRVRATEYTIDPAGGPDQGTAAMPGDLPPSSAFTYAAEFSVDQAVRAGATEVRFDKPVVTYLENFPGIDVGADVPSGWYDRETGAWKAGRDGRVIAIVAEQDGLALVDADGDGAAEGGAALAALGIDDAERRRLAQLYAPGDELWRMLLDHFTPWDFNFPWGAPDDARPPAVGPPAAGAGAGSGDPGSPKPKDPTPKDKDCGKTSSIIDCRRQSVAEVVPVQGAPFGLRYDSDRVPGRADHYNMTIPVGPAPASAKEIRVTVDVAGRRLTKTLPASARTWLAEWDGRDRYGRWVLGEQEARIEVTYLYPAVYKATGADLAASFGALAGSRVVGDRARREITAASSWTTTMGGWSGRTVGLGGWTATVHHAYDPIGRRLLRGDGGEVAIAEDVRLALLEHFAGQDWRSGAEPTPARGADLEGPAGLAVAPGGDLLVVEDAVNRVRRFAADGSRVDAVGAGSGLAAPGAVAVALDGAVLVADTLNNRVRRVDTGDGAVTTVAGGGAPADGLGDGGPATEARLRRPSGLAVAPDGSVYVSESGGHRVRRIDPSGVITTAAGTGEPGLAGDGGSGAEAELNAPQGLSVSADGYVYVADTRNDRVRRLRPDGILETVAGGGPEAAAGRDGMLATDAVLSRPRDVAIGRDGHLFIADTGTDRIRRINLDGTITTYAGGATTDDRGPTSAARARLAEPTAVAVAPDGTVYIADAGTRRILRVGAALQGFADDDTLIPSADGSQVFQFDGATGRHERTLDAFTRVPVWRFGYDGDGRLSSVTDRGGKQTLIEHDAAGNPTAIVSPRGVRTTLGVDGDGWLSRVTAAAGRSWGATYHPGGLVASFTDAGGETSSYRYDEDGRLVAATNVAGGETTLTRTETADGSRVVFRDPAGRETTYESARRTVPRDPADPAAGSVEASVFTLTLPTGGKRVQETLADGTVRTRDEQGTRTEQRFAPDPRWGPLVSYAERTEQRTPGGRTTLTTATRTVERSDAGNPLALTRQVDETNDNGRTSRSVYDHAAGTLTRVSPAGRRKVLTFAPADAGAAAGRQVSERDDDLPAVQTAYDEWGMPVRVEQGERLQAIAYDERGRAAQITDALGRGTRFLYDEADRMVSREAVDTDGSGANPATTFTYDPRGMTTSVTTGDGVTTTMGYDAFGGRSSWNSPAASAAGALPDPWTWTRRPDGSISGKATPDGRTLSLGTDAGGRPATAAHAGATTTRTFTGGSTRPAALVHAPDGGTEERTELSWDGPLATSEVATGSAPSRAEYAYSPADQMLSSFTLTSGSDVVSTAYARDQDGLATQLGPYAIDRTNGPRGAATSYAAGEDRLALGYDDLGRARTRTRTVAGQPVHDLAVERDAGDRIAATTQAVAGGSPARRTYDYDEQGRLVAVREGGVAVETYAYDARGNRTSAQRGGRPAQLVTVDRRDRVTSAGTTPYAYDAAGRLTGRGGDAFAYDAEGRLVRATAGGDAWTFAYDAMGRRVAKTGPGGTTRYLYGDPSDPGRVTAVRAPGGVLTALRYDEAGKLLALERGGTRYAVAVDQVGTPVAVADPSGAVVKAVRRDAWGVLLDDSDPSFALPIGFGGGLDDPELGLVHLGARDYEPATGRWTTTDPAFDGGGQVNLYAYVHNDPVALRDPTGKYALGPLPTAPVPDTYVPDYDTSKLRTPEPVATCVGGGAFGIIGAVYKRCWDTEGKQTDCLEFGMGLGFEAGVEFPKQIPGPGSTVGLKGAVSVGWGGVSGSFSLTDECGRPKSDWSVGGAVGPYGVSNGSEGPSGGWGGGGGDAPVGKVGLNGRGSVNNCWSSK